MISRSRLRPCAAARRAIRCRRRRERRRELPTRSSASSRRATGAATSPTRAGARRARRHGSATSAGLPIVAPRRLGQRQGRPRDVRGAGQRASRARARSAPRPSPRARDDRHDLAPSAAASCATSMSMPRLRASSYHVQRDDDLDAGLEDLVGEVEISRERRRVGDDQRRIGRAAAAAEHRVHRHLLVARARAQAVRARQSTSSTAADAGQIDDCRRAGDGDAGIVADLDVRAGERVEERGLAGVGVAGDEDDRTGRTGRGGGPPAGPPPRRDACSRHRLVHFDREGLGPADRERVVPEPQLERIAERRHARDPDARAGHEARAPSAGGRCARALLTRRTMAEVPSGNPARDLAARVAMCNLRSRVRAADSVSILILRLGLKE